MKKTQTNFQKKNRVHEYIQMTQILKMLASEIFLFITRLQNPGDKKKYF